MRKFYLTYQSRVSGISQTTSGKSKSTPKPLTQENRLLRSYVLIDLKIGKLTHQDPGQMQMYVNYFDRFVKRDDENSTIGIILCRKKNEALVEITLPKDANIHASEYQLYLPSKDELRQKLMDWTKELG
jgi:hypothetical protein